MGLPLRPDRRIGATGRSIAGARFAAAVLLFALLAFGAGIGPRPASAARTACAQPVSLGSSPTASDALFILRTAVGSQYCKRCICDLDASGTVTATDALTTLKAAVGSPANLACNSCGPPVTLECEEEGYPCSFAESDPDALDRTFVLLEALNGVRNTGSMADVRAYLESQSDVVSVYGDDRALQFRVEGAGPAYFLDVSGLQPPPSVIESEPVASQPIASQPIVTQATMVGDRGNSVVGEDSNGDAIIDNHDTKRALVLAPYEWHFKTDDESEEVATILGNLPAYQGRVVFKRNTVEPPDSQNGQITIYDYLDWEDYDVIYISTHGQRKCGLFNGVYGCFSIISTGIHWNWFAEGNPQFAVPGKVIMSTWEGPQSFAAFKLGLGLDFFRDWYNRGLDNTLVVLAACETGGSQGSELAEAMGGDDFVMMGWSEVVESDRSFDAGMILFEALNEGRTVLDGLADVENAGVSPYVNSDGNVTAFQAFTPQPVDLRIVELPRLMLDGQTLYDGANLSAFVGTGAGIGSDTLTLTLQVDGVTDATRDDFSIRYRIKNLDTVGAYDLTAASPIEAGSTTYEVEHEVELGFILGGGTFRIEVIVDLPEGGTSRFTVDAFAASCSFMASLSGGQSGIWDGSAHLIIQDDGSVCIALASSGGEPGDFSDFMQSQVCTPAATPIEPGTAVITNGMISLIDPPYFGLYYNVTYFPDMGLEDRDCGAACGGTVTFDELSEDRARGSFQVTMPEGENNHMPMPSMTMTASFDAVPGSLFQGGSPIVRCIGELNE